MRRRIVPPLALRQAAAGLALCVLLIGVQAAAAHAGTLDAFYGRWQGAGMSKGPNQEYFGMSDRDLDIKIGPSKTGFFVEWITVIRDEEDREPRRRYGRVTFEPSTRPGIFLARDSAHTIALGMSWASLDGNTLRVRVIMIEENGTYVVQTYDRSIRGDQMDLMFRSDRDGRTVRSVAGSLTRVTR